MPETYFDKITIVIVTFQSAYIIERCLDNLEDSYKKIIVENSNDINFTNKLKNNHTQIHYNQTTLVYDENHNMVQYY